jgi:hypothetical protein
MLVALGAAASISASRFIVTQSRYVQYLVIGPDKTWVDDNTSGPTTYLYAADLNWEIPWQARFWNRRLVSAGAFLGRTIPGGLPAPSVGPGNDGTLGDDRTGAKLDADYLVTSAYFAVAGLEVMRPRPDIILWRVDQPPRLLRWLEGVAFDGLAADGHARLYVYACNGGTLHGKLSADAPRKVDVSVNGLAHGAVTLKPGGVRTLAVAVGSPTDPGGVCLLDYRSDGPFFLREVAFDPATH